MAKPDFPMVPKGLLEALEARFSSALPNNPNTTLDEFRLLQGQQTVVRFLRTQYEKQTQNILEN